MPPRNSSAVLFYILSFLYFDYDTIYSSVKIISISPFREQCEGQVDMIVIAAGTGGTITGVGRRLKVYHGFRTHSLLSTATYLIYDCL